MTFNINPKPNKTKIQLRKEKVLSVLGWIILIAFFGYAIIARLFFGLEDHGSSCDLSRGGSYYCD